MRYKDRTDKLGGERNFQGKIEKHSKHLFTLTFMFYILLFVNHLLITEKSKNDSICDPSYTIAKFS